VEEIFSVFMAMPCECRENMRSFQQVTGSKPLIHQFLQLVILPPGLGHVMISENLSAGGDEKPCAEGIQVYLRPVPGNAHERVVGSSVVGWPLLVTRVMQSQAGNVVAEGKHNMDEAHARLIGLDDRLRKLALGLKLLKAAFNRGQLILQNRTVFCLADCDLRSQILALFSEVQAFADRLPGLGCVPRFQGPAASAPSTVVASTRRSAIE